MKSNVCYLITTFNRRHLLERAVSSVLPEMVNGDTLLVIDDASGDDTSEYMNSLLSTRSSVLYHRMDENSGINKVRQKAIELAKEQSCQWLTFVDDDDQLISGIREDFDKVQKQVVCDWIAYPSEDPSGNILSRFPHEGQFSYVEDYMGARDIRGDFQHFLKIDVAAQCHFTTRFKNAEEWYFWCQVDRFSPWFIRDFPGVVKQYLETGLSKSGFNRDRQLQVAEMKVDALRGNMHDKYFSKQLRNLARAKIKNGDGAGARAVLKEAIALRPFQVALYKYYLLACFK